MSILLTRARPGITPSCCRCWTRSRCTRRVWSTLQRPERVMADKAYSHRALRCQPVLETTY
jgi:hypothetical protein